MRMLGKYFALHPRREMRELLLFTVLFSFASSLIIIFEPVFFYKENFSLSWIAAYYAFHYMLYMLVLPVGAGFAARFGLERSLAISMPLFVVYFLVLASVPGVRELFYVAWILLALFKMFFWPAYHSEISKFGDEENRGTEISWLFAITRGVGVLGPLMGGVVISMFGFPVLFIIAAGLALIAGFPLLRTKEKYRPVILRYGAPWKIFFGRYNKMIRWGMMGWGENLIDMVFWPIFMIIVLGSTTMLGVIASVNVLVMTIIGFFVGEMSDRFSRRKILRLHIPFMMIGYLFRPLSGNATRIFFTDMLGKAAYIGQRVPMWYRVYKRGSSHGYLRYMTAVEIAICISKAATAWVLVVVFAVMTPWAGFITAFVAAAILSMFYLFV